MQKIIGEFWEKIWLSGVEVENVLGIKGAFWEKNLLSWGRGGYIWHLWHIFGSKLYFSIRICSTFGIKPQMIIDQKKNRKKKHKFVAILLTKIKKVHAKHVLRWNIHYFLVFFIKRILHYNRAILHWIIKKNQENTWKIRFAKEYPWFLAFFIKRILHYNRPILHWT